VLQFNDDRVVPTCEAIKELLRLEAAPLAFSFLDGDRWIRVSICLDAQRETAPHDAAAPQATSADYTAAEELERRVRASETLSSLYALHRESLTAIADRCTEAQDYRGRALVFELLRQVAESQRHFRVTRQLYETCWLLKSSPLVNRVRTPGELHAGEAS